MAAHHYLEYNSEMNPRARKLRKEMTRQERHLWYDFLRSYPLKIYRQRVIDSFIVDFYCASAKLVIELDGSQHYDEEGLAYDAMRTKALEGYGLKVVRFSNLDIDKNFEGVCAFIDDMIQEALEKDEAFLCGKT